MFKADNSPQQVIINNVLRFCGPQLKLNMNLTDLWLKMNWVDKSTIGLTSLPNFDWHSVIMPGKTKHVNL